MKLRIFLRWCICEERLILRSLLWVFDFIIFLFCIIKMVLVLWIVERWWVIIIVVWLIINLFNVFCISCFEFVFKVLVVLFRRRMVGFFNMVLVIVIFCFWFLESCIFFFFICVLYFCGNLLMKECVLEVFVIVVIFVVDVFFLLYRMFFSMFVVNKIGFWFINLIFFCS